MDSISITTDEMVGHQICVDCTYVFEYPVKKPRTTAVLFVKTRICIRLKVFTIVIPMIENKTIASIVPMMNTIRCLSHHIANA